jgi:hypothetical protein
MSEDDEAAPIGDNIRGRLASVVNNAMEVRDQIESLDLRRELLAERYKTLTQEIIPEIMSEIGIGKTTMEDGTAVSLSLSVHAGISNPAAYKWLDDNGFSGIIKTKLALSFSREEREEAITLIEKLSEMGYETELAETVHPMTLKSWAKERIEKSEPLPDDLFSIHHFTEAKLKKGKQNDSRKEVLNDGVNF